MRIITYPIWLESDGNLTAKQSAQLGLLGDRRIMVNDEALGNFLGKVSDLADPYLPAHILVKKSTRTKAPTVCTLGEIGHMVDVVDDLRDIGKTMMIELTPSPTLRSVDQLRQLFDRRFPRKRLYRWDVTSFSVGERSVSVTGMYRQTPFLPDEGKLAAIISGLEHLEIVRDVFEDKPEPQRSEPTPEEDVSDYLAGFQPAQEGKMGYW